MEAVCNIFNSWFSCLALTSSSKLGVWVVRAFGFAATEGGFAPRTGFRVARGYTNPWFPEASPCEPGFCCCCAVIVAGGDGLTAVGLIGFGSGFLVTGAGTAEGEKEEVALGTNAFCWIDRTLLAGEMLLTLVGALIGGLFAGSGRGLGGTGAPATGPG